MNGAQWLVKTLYDKGVRHVFTLCGNGLNPFLDACLDGGLTLIDVRNEQAASYMADATGRLTRTLGVAAVSSGPGHTNALTGLANAAWDGGPMLLISGCSGQSTRGLDNFQELDQVGMAAPVCKYARFVSRVENLPTEIHNALTAAVTGRPGPVHLTIPQDVLGAPLDAPPTLRTPATVAPVSAASEEGVLQAIEMLTQARRPLMIVGSGAFYADAWDALRSFALKTHIPFFTHIWDRGCVEVAIPEYVGVTNGELNGAYAKLQEADLIFTLGARVDYRLGHGKPPLCAEDARWIRVDVSGEEAYRALTPDLALIGDPATVLRQISERLEACDHRKWLGEVREAHDALIRHWESRVDPASFPIHGLNLCRAIQPFLREAITFLIDGGNIGRWAHMLLFDRHPAHWLTCGASGVVGFGLPGAVAAKLIYPDRPLLLLSGDGAAGFTITEIETALRFKTPYVALIAHDSAWGIVAEGQPEDRRAASLLGEIRFDKVAEALGARGVCIDRPEALTPAIDEALRSDTVTFIHVPTQLQGVRA